MSDWEDEYDEKGVAIEKLALKATSTNQKLVGKVGQGDGNVYFGGKNQTWFGKSSEARDERGEEVFDFRSRRTEMDRGGGTRERRSRNEISDGSQSFNFKVENESIGRIIGTFNIFKFQCS